MLIAQSFKGLLFPGVILAFASCSVENTANSSLEITSPKPTYLSVFNPDTDKYGLGIDNNHLIIAKFTDRTILTKLNVAITALIGNTISAGYGHNLALKSDGTVVAWGDNLFGQTDIPAGLSNVVAISAGSVHNLALKNDGTLVAWGVTSIDSLDHGQSNVPAGLSGVVAISAGWLHSLALKADGTVIGWGADDTGQATVPAGLVAKVP